MGRVIIRTELDVDRIEANGVDEATEVGIGEGALRSSGDVVLLRGTVEVVAELSHHGGVVGSRRGLDIEVNTVQIVSLQFCFQ